GTAQRVDNDPLYRSGKEAFDFSVELDLDVGAGDRVSRAIAGVGLEHNDLIRAGRARDGEDACLEGRRRSREEQSLLQEFEGARAVRPAARHVSCLQKRDADTKGTHVWSVLSGAVHPALDRFYPKMAGK